MSGDKQPISAITIRVPDDAFWNRLADDTGIDLHDLELVGANELPNGDIEYVMRRREKKFDQAAIDAAFRDEQINGGVHDRYREG